MLAETVPVAGTGEPAAPPIRLTAAGLTKSYGAHRVLEGVDLALPAGSIVAVSGPNGAGKTTLLSCLAGTIVFGGQVRLDGRPIRAAGRGRVTFLPQRVQLPATATVGEVLALFGELRGGRPDRVALPDGFLPAPHRPVGQLSGGQRQRVALAATLLGAPDLLLLDEPMANLDDDARGTVMALLAEHRAAGATILVASPTAVDLLTTVDRVVVVQDGRLAYDGTAAAYFAGLEVTLWVRAGDGRSPDALASLPHVLRARREGDWVALDCREDRSVELLKALDGRGVTPDQVRLGGPDRSARRAPSPPAGTP